MLCRPGVERRKLAIRHGQRGVDPVAPGNYVACWQDLYQKRDYGLCFGQALTSARSDLDRHVALVRGN